MFVVLAGVHQGESGVGEHQGEGVVGGGDGVVWGIGKGGDDPVEGGRGGGGGHGVGGVGVAEPGCGVGGAVCGDGVEEGLDAVGACWERGVGGWVGGWGWDSP